MRVRLFELDDFEEVVGMYYELEKVIHSHRKIGKKIFFYAAVIGWVNDGHDIHVAVNDKGETVGFTHGYVNTTSGITEPIYEHARIFVKEEHRKSKAAYMMYKNSNEMARQRGLISVSNAFIGDKEGMRVGILEKFGCEQMFINMERSA